MSKIRDYILWTIAILFVVSLVFNARTCQTSLTGTASDTTRVTIYDTIPYIKPNAKDSGVVGYITERLPVADVKEDNFPNKTVTELPESVQKFPESDKNLQDSVQNFGKIVPDSVNVVIPITQKVYEDSTYTAYVSGYKASLDSLIMRMPNTTTTIVKTDERSRWSISVHGGYGLTLTKQPRFEPYIGIGISYNLYTFKKLKHKR